MDSTNPSFSKTPWHLSTPLYQRLPSVPNLPYRTCQVTQPDPEWGFIHKLFQLHKPHNYSIATVDCIHNTNLSTQFQSAIANQEQEVKTPYFAPQWSQENPAPLRHKTMNRWNELTKPYSPFFIQWPNQRKDLYNHTKVIPLWHGTKAPICDSICSTGFTTFGKHEIIHNTGKTQNTDIGYFGSGIYFTTSAKYAANTYSDGNLLLAWVSLREPYPVVADRICLPPQKPSDMKKLEGLGAYQNYNAHYIPVISVNPSDDNCAVYYPCAETQNPAWDEIVVFQKSQTLPSFWVKLQPDLLKSPNLRTVQHLLDHVLNLLENAHLDQHPSLFELLEQKSEVLIAIHSNDPLTPQDQEFYNWSLRLLDETGKVRNYVQKKLQGLQSPLTPILPTTSNAPTKILTLEDKYEEAKSYETGQGKPKNPAQAFKMYEELSLAGYTPALVDTAYHLCHGIGTQIDRSRAAKLTKEALSKELTPAQKGVALCLLGLSYEEGHFENRSWIKDTAQAETFYQESFDLEDPLGGAFLSRLYFLQDKKPLAEKVIGSVISQLTEQAEKGHALAQTRLGYCYASGQGIKKDEAQAFYWYQKAADQGYARAQSNLGICYANGQGVNKDEAQAVSWYQKAADQGHAYAQYNLGFCYKNGRGVKRDEAQAVSWYQKAADQGDAGAQRYLGLCYKNGQGVNKDEAQAVSWYQKAADQGDAGAQRYLGICYANGQGVNKDEAQAVSWYQKAADQGDVGAQRYLGIRYANGQGVNKDEAQAVSWYQKAADQGNAKAQHSLGLCYKNGRGVKRDEAQAVSWYQKAADQGNANAQYGLGVCYYHGLGVNKDEAQTVSWYQKAADQGYANAQYGLAYCYANGQGVKRDEAQAVSWYQKAADQGYAHAQYNLGVCYANGQGVKRDEVQAVSWYQKAADQGNANAQYNLGVCYANGQGVKRDEAQAVSWYQKAADQGNANAQYGLGVCYANGQGVKRDEAQAVSWFQKAADQGNANAQNNLGVCYYHGLGVNKDEAQAVSWYQKAADQEHANAQYDLGVCYANGQGVKRDEAQAVCWYQKAADQGNANAQYGLGYCYANGQGIKRDEAQAVFWYQKAADQGHAGAKKTN